MAPRWHTAAQAQLEAAIQGGSQVRIDALATAASAAEALVDFQRTVAALKDSE